MNDLTATIEAESWNRLERAMQILSQQCGRRISDIVQQASIMAIQSATKATHPSRASSPKTLPKGKRFRPLVAMPPDSFWYVYESKKGQKLFKAKQMITPRRDLKRVTKAVEVWSKRQQKMIYRPWIGPKDESKKIFRIPHAGAAKAGWIGAYRRLGKPGADTNGMDNLTTVQDFRTAFGRTINIINEVSYVSKTSPFSALEGLATASKRMLKTAEAGIDKLASGVQI